MAENVYSQFEKRSNSDEEIGLKSGLGGAELTLVHLSPNGPKVENIGYGQTKLEKDAIPEEQLTPMERAAIEALPALRSGAVCAPLSPEEIKAFGNAVIGYCRPEDTKNLSPADQLKVRERDRVSLTHRDKVARTKDGGYLIIHPLEFVD